MREHEHTDIEPSIATRFAVWLTVAMLISVGHRLRHLLALRGPRAGGRAGAQQFPLAVGQTREPPGPRLQTQPFKDIYLLRQAEHEKLIELRLGRSGHRRRAHSRSRTRSGS